jgi:3-hydroxymyristoyl/3-hydroxydecanoyl-(acyl carrier protein) dehydratase
MPGVLQIEALAQTGVFLLLTIWVKENTTPIFLK